MLLAFTISAKQVEQGTALAIAQSYLKNNNAQQPKVSGQTRTIKLNTLYSSKYIDKVVDYKKETCSGAESYVKAFKYEDEIRIILVKKNATKENGIKVTYDCDNTDLIHQIVLDPNLGDSTSRMLKKVFATEYGFKPFVGTFHIHNTVRVLQSQLYTKKSIAELHID